MSPKILSVDDSKAVRMLLARLFRPFACELFEAANGEEGLAAALRERPDLIILDYNMPVMDGVSMLRQLREHADLRRTPVIMLTAEFERGEHRHRGPPGCSRLRHQAV